jgi:hypothetical protein
MHEKFNPTEIYIRKPIKRKETKHSNSKFEKKKSAMG